MDIHNREGYRLFEQSSEENDVPEEEVIECLLSGKPARVYHLLSNPDDFEGVVKDGLRGSYTIRTSPSDPNPLLGSDGRPLTRAYFRLTRPLDKGAYIFFDLNEPDTIPLKIYDGRKAEIPIWDLLGDGYDGHIRDAGVVPGGRQYKFMLTLFDGASLKGLAQKLE